MRFLCELRHHWPLLAWLAELRRGDEVVRVLHGTGVEIDDNAICEAVWDGPFTEKELDRTDLIFGSGARIRDGRAVFVSSGATVDRLHVLETDGVVRISNSLPCVLAASEATADPHHSHYFTDFKSVIKGQDEHTRFIPTSRGPLRLVYFRNLAWDGSMLLERDKPNAARRFGSFAQYHEFLSSGIARSLDNARDSARRFALTPLGTLSSGYDSPTVAALAREHGLAEVISYVDARGGWIEDGRPIAAALGLTILPVQRNAWRTRPLAEVPFLAADGRGEDVFFAGAEKALRGRVLLTGFHGDKIWDRWTKPAALNALIKRGDQSGMTLTEYRLGAGFVHFPVPFMGVRAIADVHRISNAEEMRPWDVRGKYSRPICRRILEEAGVPRDRFGQKKKAASVLFSGDEGVYSPETRREHAAWSRRSRDAWLMGRCVAPHWVDRTLEANLRIYSVCIDSGLFLLRKLSWLSRPATEWIDEKVEKHRYFFPELLRKRLLHRTLFAWAVERAMERYRIPMHSSVQAAESTQSRARTTADV